MNHLIDAQTQEQLAMQIDSAVEKVLSELTNHGNEEAITSALGHALMQKSIVTRDLTVNFSYRQHNKNNEEPNSGADGGFLVRVKTPGTNVEKAALFQAKLLRGEEDVRTLTMSKADARRLSKQSKDMLKHTEEAVAMFYTWKNIYVVDAFDYQATAPIVSTTPLSEEHRLITLGTYLGRWLPRCTKGDLEPNFLTRVKHSEGFKHGLTLDVVSKRPSVTWDPDLKETAWRRKK